LRSRPADIDDHELVAEVSRLWGLELVRAEYTPVGGGTHHWRAVDGLGRGYWLNVDDLDLKAFLGSSRSSTFAGLRRALDTAVALHEAGLEFVVAPLPMPGGECLAQFGAHYAIAVCPFVLGATRAFEEVFPKEERSKLLRLLARLHAATPAVRDTATAWQLEIALRGELESALADDASTWTGGPLSESARALIHAQASLVRRALSRFDDLAEEVTEATAASDLVVTHGEPHPGNLLMTPDGHLRLVDWDTVALAPPERDLWLVRGFEGDANRAALKLYSLRWKLADIASFLDVLRAPHADTADTRHALRALELSLEMIQA
jgi:spectinomycin phosphotransferase